MSITGNLCSHSTACAMHPATFLQPLEVQDAMGSLNTCHF